MLSPCLLTVGLMYAKRLKKKNSSFAQRISSSDLFLVSMASHLFMLSVVFMLKYDLLLSECVLTPRSFTEKMSFAFSF